MSKWDTVFELGDKLTAEELEFFDKHGIIVFRNFITHEKVQEILNEISIIEKQWLEDGRDKINGIPLRFGKDEEGNKIIQRFCFVSLFSEKLHAILTDPRLKILLDLLHPYEGRIGENEKDGLVMNNYLYLSNSSFSQMGWHTDSPRDIFMGQKIMPMLNVGIHIDDCPYENGGLRVIPGSNKQGLFKLLFGKKYFIDNTPDPKEIGYDMFSGDLSVHDGRLWHRAQQSPYIGEKSRRRVMYVPFITGKYLPKHAGSRTPFYHHFSRRVNH